MSSTSACPVEAEALQRVRTGNITLSVVLRSVDGVSRCTSGGRRSAGGRSASGCVMRRGTETGVSAGRCCGFPPMAGIDRADTMLADSGRGPDGSRTCNAETLELTGNSLSTASSPSPHFRVTGLAFAAGGRTAVREGGREACPRLGNGLAVGRGQVRFGLDAEP
jgi:hypothetical protein